MLSADFTGASGLFLLAAEPLTSFDGGRDEVRGDSTDFAIRIVTVSRLKNDFLFGIPRYAGDARFVKYQPTNISGVTVLEVSRSHPLGLYPLTYTYHIDVTTNASVQIGTYLGINGTVDIEAIGPNEGVVGNLWSVQVVVPTLGTSPLTVTASANLLTINLAVNMGVLDPAANTALLIAAAMK